MLLLLYYVKNNLKFIVAGEMNIPLLLVSSVLYLVDRSMYLVDKSVNWMDWSLHLVNKSVYLPDCSVYLVVRSVYLEDRSLYLADRSDFLVTTSSLLLSNAWIWDCRSVKSLSLQMLEREMLLERSRPPLLILSITYSCSHLYTNVNTKVHWKTTALDKLKIFYSFKIYDYS